MAIAPAFKKSVENGSDWLSLEMGTQMMEKGFPFRSFRSTNDGPEIPDPYWEEIVEQLGGEDAVEAVYDGKDNFTVRHLASGVEVTSNGAVDALAQLWLAIQQ